MKRNVSLIAIALIIVLSSGMILALGACEKEEPTPWWKDWENIQIVFEDERSEEKSIILDWSNEERIMFHYTYHSEDTEEYIPRVRVLYQGVEQEFYLKILDREGFYLYPDGYDFDHPTKVNIVNEVGAYRIYLLCQHNEEDESPLTNFITSRYIYIIVSAEEKVE